MESVTRNLNRVITGLVLAVLLCPMARAECISIAALLAKTQERFPGVTIAHEEMTGMEAHAFAAAASKQTGHEIDADEIGFFTSPKFAPRMLIIFATNGCAHDVVTFTPDGENG